MSNTVADYQTYANLQMLAEAIKIEVGAIPVGTGSWADVGNDRSSKTPLEIAEQMNEQGWTVAAYLPNKPTGLSATLFKSRSGEFVLCIRSTEFIDDAVRDSKATNELEIKDTGFAIGQLADLEKWYQETVKPMVGASAMTVTGYSLGGHVATAFEQLHRGDGAVAQVFNFNGAGVGSVNGGHKLADVLAEFDKYRSDDKNLSYMFTTPEALKLYQEVRAMLGAHQRLTDALVARTKGLGQSFTIGDQTYAPAQGSMKTWRRNGRVLTAMAAALTACSSNWNGPLEAEAAIRKAPEFQARYEKAEALFKKRCETAGEFIYKTVPDVKGVVWMKWRISSPTQSIYGQFDMTDPYGRDCGNEFCIEHLLKATEGRHFAAETKIPIGAGEYGYDYVETTSPKDGHNYRYAMRYFRPAERGASGVIPNFARAELHKREIDRFTARYGITWDDISTREDRENWIAGGSLSVVDLSTNEVIAKRVGYMMDLGLGSTVGFRSPWALARRENSCPPLPKDRVSGQSYPREQEKTDFLFKVLQPTKGEAK